MATVGVDQARAGMVLLEEVRDRKGRLLIPTGNELSERHVQALKMWGVTSLEIEGDEAEADVLVDVSPQMVAAAETATDLHFGENDVAHPFIETLRRCVIKRRAGALAAAEPVT